MSITKSNHCAYDTHYHVVFPVKYRKALLYPHVTSAIQEIARDISERYDITFEQMGTAGDHVHIICSFHPKISGAEMVGTFKSITAIQVFKRCSSLLTGAVHLLGFSEEISKGLAWRVPSAADRFPSPSSHLEQLKLPK